MAREAGDRGASAVIESAADARLFRRAVNQGWKIPPEAFEVAPKELLEIIRKPDKQRTAISATRALIACHAQNVGMDVASHRAMPVAVGDDGEMIEGEATVVESMSIAYLEDLTLEAKAERIRILEETGILSGMIATENNGADG